MIAETRNHKDDFLAGIKVEVSWKIRGSFGKFQDNFKPCNKVLLTGSYFLEDVSFFTGVLAQLPLPLTCVSFLNCKLVSIRTIQFTQVSFISLHSNRQRQE